MKDRFSFIALEEAKQFLESLDKKSRKKVMYNVWKTKSINDKELFKPVQGEIWEFRTLYNKKYIRIFAFWDKADNQNTLVAATHGIYRTTSKILKSDIERAERIRKEYYHSKNK